LQNFEKRMEKKEVLPANHLPLLRNRKIEKEKNKC
jgi:hypothetical protein